MVNLDVFFSIFQKMAQRVLCDRFSDRSDVKFTTFGPDDIKNFLARGLNFGLGQKVT